MRSRLSVASVVAALLVWSSGCEQVLFEGVDERAANEMVAALAQAGIAASKSYLGRDGHSVSVPAQRFADSVRVLEDAGLPRRPVPIAADVLGADSLVRSPVVERALVAEAQAHELRAALLLLPGVQDVAVRVASADRGGATALVIMTWRGEHSISAGDVRGMAAASVVGLDANDVVVTMRDVPPTEVEFEIEQIGPLVVPADQAPRTRGILAGFAAVLASVALVAAGWARKRRGL